MHYLLHSWGSTQPIGVIVPGEMRGCQVRSKKGKVRSNILDQEPLTDIKEPPLKGDILEKYSVIHWNAS